MVPGISGGTVAFLLGLYDALIESIYSFNARAVKHLFSLHFSKFFGEVHWQFLLTLGCGMLTAFILFSQWIHQLLGHPVYRVYLFSLFIGLVLAAALFCAKQVKHWRPVHSALFLIGVVLAALFSFPRAPWPSHEATFDVSLAKERLPPQTFSLPIANYEEEAELLTNVKASTLSAMLSKNIVDASTPVYSHQQKARGHVSEFVSKKEGIHLDLWLFMCGTIGVCAMLLPGISGSYMLTVLGAYPIVIGALADFIDGLKQFRWEGEALAILGSLFLGIAAGAVLFSRFLRWLLAKHHNNAISLLTGFMVGALPAVWPFWTYEYFIPPLKLEKAPQLQALAPYLPELGSELVGFSLLFVCLGFFSVFFLEHLTHKSRALK